MGFVLATVFVFPSPGLFASYHATTPSLLLLLHHQGTDWPVDGIGSFLVLVRTSKFYDPVSSCREPLAAPFAVTRRPCMMCSILDSSAAR